MKNNYDVIIIGSGIAGLTVALSLPQQCNVLLVTKSKLSDGATKLAQGGIAAVVGSDDSVESHIRDTLEAGDFHNKKIAVSLLSKNSQNAIIWLQGLGVPFAVDKHGSFLPSLEAAHSAARIVHTSDFTGRDIESILIKHLLLKNNIDILEKAIASKLLVSNNRCYGIEYLAQKKFIAVYANHIVLATGGAGQLYEWTTNPKTATGDGVALAKRAGAQLSDMEFVQFHPTALKHGNSPLFLLSEALRGEGAHIIDEAGHRFLFDTLESGEMAPRDEISRAIFIHQKKHAVFLDMHQIDSKFIRKRFPNIYTELKKRGYDLTTDMIPITPAAHYLCGGIKTDLLGSTHIKQLYAAGEVAATGVHGANRLASNSLLEGIVYGKQVADAINKNKSEPSASKHLKGEYAQSLQQKVSLSLYSINTKRIRSIKLQIKKIMWKKVGIMRTKRGLIEAKGEITKLIALVNSAGENKISQEYFEVRNMIEAADAVIKASLRRTKSLGAHFIS